MSPNASKTLEKLLPFSRAPPAIPSPSPPLLLFTGCVSLQRALAPQAMLFLEPPLATLFASQHTGAIHWTFIPFAVTDLFSLAHLPREHDVSVLILPNVSPLDEAIARRVALSLLHGCGVVVVRDKGGRGARTAAAACRGQPEWGEALFGTDDVVVPPGTDSRNKIMALVDAEGLREADVFAEDIMRREIVEKRERKTEMEVGNEEDVRRRAREEERQWRMQITRVGRETMEKRAREKNGQADGEEDTRVGGTGDDEGGEKKSDFFLQLLAKSL